MPLIVVGIENSAFISGRVKHSGHRRGTVLPITCGPQLETDRNSLLNASPPEGEGENQRPTGVDPSHHPIQPLSPLRWHAKGSTFVRTHCERAMCVPARASCHVCFLLPLLHCPPPSRITAHVERGRHQPVLGCPHQPRPRQR